MIGRVSFNRKDRVSVCGLFQECDRIIRTYTNHPGFSKEVRFFFSYSGLTLRRDQEVRNLIKDWASTATSSRSANHAAGAVGFTRSARWDDFFAGKVFENGFSMTLVCPGLSLGDAEGLHRLLETMYDDDFYVAFDLQTPESISGFAYSREFSC